MEPITKNSLRDFQRLKQEAKQLQEQLQQSDLALISLKSPVLSGMPSAGKRTQLEDKIERVEQLRHKYAEAAQRVAMRQLEIEEAIESLEVLERVLIRYKYIDGYSWVKIAAEMNYSEPMLYIIHGHALNKLKDYRKL